MTDSKERLRRRGKLGILGEDELHLYFPPDEGVFDVPSVRTQFRSLRLPDLVQDLSLKITPVSSEQIQDLLDSGAPHGNRVITSVINYVPQSKFDLTEEFKLPFDACTVSLMCVPRKNSKPRGSHRVTSLEMTIIYPEETTTLTYPNFQKRDHILPGGMLLNTSRRQAGNDWAGIIRVENGRLVYVPLDVGAKVELPSTPESRERQALGEYNFLNYVYYAILGPSIAALRRVDSKAAN